MADGTPDRFHQAVCKTAIAPERCIIAPYYNKGWISSSLLQIVNHFCQGQYDLLLTEREFQQLHHLVIGQHPRAERETFQHPAAGTETLRARLAG